MYHACHRHEMFVSLTDAEYDEAVDHGRSLYAASQTAGSVHDRRAFVRDGVTGERVQIIGALAECAGAKALGLPWRKDRFTFKQPDLAHNVEVRLIGKDHYGLRVSPRDADSRRVLGIVIERGREREPYRIPGWINAVYGKRPEYLMDPLGRQQPIYAVPQERLYSPWTLLALITSERLEEVAR